MKHVRALITADVPVPSSKTDWMHHEEDSGGRVVWEGPPKGSIPPLLLHGVVLLRGPARTSLGEGCGDNHPQPRALWQPDGLQLGMKPRKPSECNPNTLFPC